MILKPLAKYLAKKYAADFLVELQVKAVEKGKKSPYYGTMVSLSKNMASAVKKAAEASKDGAVSDDEKTEIREAWNTAISDLIGVLDA